MKMARLFNEHVGKQPEIVIAYEDYAPSYREALVMVRNGILSAAMAIQDLPLDATWDQIARQKGPIGLLRAAQFITSRELAWEDVRKTIGSMSAAGKFDKILPAVPQRQLLVDLLAGACKHVAPTYKAE